MRSRQFAVAVVACAVAAGIALFAASRTWLVEVVARPDPLPAISTDRTGGWLVPLLPALALVALAGAGGLLATRGRARTAVATVLILAGLGVAASPVGTLGRAGVSKGWPVAAMLAGLVVAGVGVLAIRYGRSWPVMGARYERLAESGEAGETVEVGKAGGPRPRVRTRDANGRPDQSAAKLWDALDRGEDPTKSQI